MLDGAAGIWMVVESPSGGLLSVMPDATDTTNNILTIYDLCGLEFITKLFSDMLLFLEYIFVQDRQVVSYVHHDPDSSVFHQCAIARAKRDFDDFKCSSSSQDSGSGWGWLWLFIVINRGIFYVSHI